MHKKSRGDIIAYMDDDDFYPPERVFAQRRNAYLPPRGIVKGAVKQVLASNTFRKHINLAL